jgi:hypothetical protein
MGRILSAIFQAAGLALGLYMIWPDIAFYVQTSSADGGAGRLTLLQTLERGEHIFLYLTLVLLPAVRLLKEHLGHKLYSVLEVFLFAALSVLLARTLHASFIDGYVFLISKHQVWNSIARPAAIFFIVAGNWLIAFLGIYRAVKVAGE